MRNAVLILTALALLGWAVIQSGSPSQADEVPENGEHDFTTQPHSPIHAADPTYDPLTRSTVVKHVAPPSAEVLEIFNAHLIELYSSQDGRQFRYNQQSQRVDNLLRAGKETPVDHLSELLDRSGTLVPIRSLDAYQAVGLREMDFLHNTIAAHARTLKQWPAEAFEGGAVDEEHEGGRQTGGLQAKIKGSPLSFPPEVIFVAFSPSKRFPVDNDAFIHALSSSRDNGLFVAAASWMEYTAWRSSAQWMTSFPEYAAADISDTTLKGLPPLVAAMSAYQEAEQQYLMNILGDMVNYGYLE